MSTSASFAGTLIRSDEYMCHRLAHDLWNEKCKYPVSKVQRKRVLIRYPLTGFEYLAGSALLPPSLCKIPLSECTRFITVSSKIQMNAKIMQRVTFNQCNVF